MDLYRSTIGVKLWPIVIIILTARTASASFGYSRRSQHIWPQEFKSCAGKRQSPIAISSTKSVALPLPALEMNGYRDYLSGAIKLKNNGHSVSITDRGIAHALKDMKLTVALSVSKETSRKRLPHVFGAMLHPEQEYELDGLHFHWGMKNNRGSEHTLNGVRFPMEMHIIHRNIKYKSINEALEFENGLAVLGIFFQLQEDNNERLGPLIKSLPNVKWIDLEESMNMSIVLSSLLPKDTDVYYTYRGSLTTPPCSEAVTWIIFPTPVPISFRQMDKFRTLSNGETVLADNYRHLQDIGNRKIYTRRLGPSFASNPDMINLNVTQLNWYWQ